MTFIRHWVYVYEYDPQLRPGTIGADFESDNPNECYTIRYERDEAEKMMQDIYKWAVIGV